MLLQTHPHASLASLLICATALLLVTVLPASRASARGHDTAPALGNPPGDHTIVNVSTAAALQDAVTNASSKTTIVLAAGTYYLTNTLHLHGGRANIVLRGATGDRDDVKVLGKGMTNSNYGNVPHCVLISDATDITIADMTLGDVWFHPVAMNPGSDRVVIRNCRLFDAGEQFVKASTDGNKGTDDSIVEYCLLEYTSIGPADGYTNGVDVHNGARWIIRDNLFRNIHVPVGAEHQFGPAVLMWNGSRDTVCERNTFINCDRAIAFGLTNKSNDGAGTFDHRGGVIRNNFVYLSSAIANSDAMILVWDSPDTKVLHNTVFDFGSANYPNAIEYRFAGTTGLVIRDNLVNKAITARNGASASVSNNITNASTSLVEDAANGDLHLKSSAAVAIDQATANGTTDDWDAGSRPAGDAPDIGADEYVDAGGGGGGAGGGAGGGGGEEEEQAGNSVGVGGGSGCAARPVGSLCILLPLMGVLAGLVALRRRP